MASQTRRTDQRFPSRQYRYEFPVSSPGMLMDAPELKAGGVYRFLLGRDEAPLELPKDEPGVTPADPFARLVLFSGGPPPLSLRALLAALDAVGLTSQRSFVVADGGQIPWSPATDDLERNFRLVVTRQRPGEAQPDILISASTDIDSEENFLQVIAWDDVAGASQFYERRDRVWMSAGSGWDAFAPDTRGKGPFDSHVNGALNMKELKLPWLHWHSPSAAISDEVLAPADPLRSEPLWTGRSLADDLERTIVRPGIQRWTDSRFKRMTDGVTLKGLPNFFRQVLGTSTVNLTSSMTSASAVAGGADVKLPATFVVDIDALLGTIGLEPDLAVPVVKARIYASALNRFEVRLKAGDHEISGDTHFVFVVPEPAFEDILVLERLIELGILSDRMAAALLMVDFENAVFSPRRLRLLDYVPAEGRIGGAAELEAALVRVVESVPEAARPGSAEHELLANWALPADAWRGEYERRIESFSSAVATACATAEGFAGIFALAESRRREFRTRKLAEFRLTTPFTNIPETAPLLEFDAGGRVRSK